MSCGLNLAVRAGIGGAVPLHVSLEMASITFFVPVLETWLMRGVPETTVDIGLLEPEVPSL